MDWLFFSGFGSYKGFYPLSVFGHGERNGILRIQHNNDCNSAVKEGIMFFKTRTDI